MLQSKKCIKKIGVLLLIFLLLSQVLTGYSQSEDSGNLLKNGSFEETGNDGMPSFWGTDAWIRQEGYTSFSVDSDSYEDGNCAQIHNIGMNDARFTQKVAVKPNTCYRLSGMIRSATDGDEGRGANLSIDGVYAFSESVYDSNGQWVFVELYGKTGPGQREVTVFARLGGYSGESTGVASFDSLRLEEVESVPEDALLYAWYLPENTVENEETSEAAETSSFRKENFISAALYAAIFLIALLMLDSKKQWNRKKTAAVMAVGMAAAYILRMIAALQVEGYQVDVNCFTSWAKAMATYGPGKFYQSVSFCDYTPGYLYVLWLAGKIGASIIGVSFTFVLKQMPIFCDIISAMLIYVIARQEKAGRNVSCFAALMAAFSPAMAINSAAWCQIDSVLCLGILLVAWLAIRKKWSAVLPVYVVCALIKPQALMLGPLGLAVIITELIRQPKIWKQLLIGLGISAAAACIIVIPFSVNQPSPAWLFSLYGDTLASYPYATVNAANLCYLLGGNWQKIESQASPYYGFVMAAISLAYGTWLYFRQCRKEKTALCWAEPALNGAFAVFFLICGIMSLSGKCSWNVIGAGAMAWAFAVVIPAYLRHGDVKKLPLCGAVLFILLYSLGIKMHERYIFPALMLLAMAFCTCRDKKILILLAALTCTTFVNEGIVLDNSLCLGSSMGHLNNDTLLVNNAISAVCALSALLSLYLLNCSREGNGEAHGGIIKVSEKKANISHDPSLNWQKTDTILVAAVTLVYSVIALWNLGSVKAPQNPWKSSSADEQIVLDLEENQTDFSMAYFCGVSYSDFSVAVSDDKENWSPEYFAQMDQGQCFRWKYLSPCESAPDGTRSYYGGNSTDNLQRLSGRYVRITSQQIGLVLNEVIFKDCSGNVLPVKLVERIGGYPDSPNYSDPKNVIDEQDTMVGEPGWYNGTYFDEIYHARTGFEMLNGTVTYETTHPPLGKIFIMLGIGIFGMTPFGWRISGALVGIIMVPVMYVLAKQLVKRRDAAFAAMTMLALDCMHLTQTRIATIDSYPVLFIMLSYLFMLRFMQTDFLHEPWKKILPMLALSGLFMGCGIASKWIGCYSAVGLALLFLWACLREYRAAAEKGSEEGQKAFARIWHICLWCLLFFIAVPAVTYLLAYIPHLSYAKAGSFGEYLQLVMNAQTGMFNYHSTPGLGMDHPFYSPWYEWPLIKRPMYYAMAQFVPEGWSYSIFCFGNPAVWYVGIAGIAWTVFIWAKRHFYTAEGSSSILHGNSSVKDITPGFILIGLLSQFLPWVLVPRGTYIYHYFASIPFLILGTALLLCSVIKRFPKLGKWILVVYLVTCLIWFVGFYPYASGTLTPVGWLDFMKKFLNVYHS